MEIHSEAQISYCTHHYYLVMVMRIWLVPTVMLPMCAMITVITSNTQNSMPSTRPLQTMCIRYAKTLIKALLHFA